MSKPIIVTCVADTHPNSMAGLAPHSGLDLDGGGHYKPSVLQTWQYDKWLDFWNFTEGLMAKYDADLWVFDVGDGADDNKHSHYGLISVNQTDIINLGVAVRARPRELATEYIMFRGTEAHSGGYGYLEEQIAQRIQASRNAAGAYSWWSGLIECAGVLFDVQHHPKNRSYQPWTAGSAAARESSYLEHVYARRQFPDIAIRAHVHHLEDTGGTHSIRTIFLPAWQMLTPYGSSRGEKGYSPIGGLVFLCQDGEHDGWIKMYDPPEEEVWRPS